MRLVKVEKVKQGDIIGQDIISITGAILLRQSSVFKEAYKSYLLAREITHIYIDDEISKGIEPTSILSNQARMRIFNDLNHEFDKLKVNLSVNYEVLSQTTSLLLQEISNKDIMCEISDLKTNHSDTYNHCIGVAIMAAVVSKKMKLSEELTEKVVLGALLHDIGKVIIPKDILDKPAALTKEEYDIIKSHPTTGYEILKDNINISPITKVAVLCHHEREDGKGYPLGKGEDLHIGAKIVGACDLFHALISDRSYRKGMPINRAIMIAKGEKINNEVREAVESILAFYAVGETVGLSNGDFGIVEKNFADDLQRPIVRIIYKNKVGKIRPYKLDLREHLDIYIVDKLPDFEY